MDGQVGPQSWQAAVKAVLCQRHRGPPLDDTQLRNLHISLRLPLPIPTSRLVRDHLLTFPETVDGYCITWNLELRRGDMTENPDKERPLELCSEATATFIRGCMRGLADQILGENKYEIITGRPLIIPLPTSSGGSSKPNKRSNSRPNGTPAFKYPVDAIFIHTGENGYRSCIIKLHRRLGQMQLSAAEVFCLVGLAIESRSENPGMPVHYVEVFAVHGMQFRRLRARIPSTYLNSLLAPRHHFSDTLSDGFIVEQIPYVDNFGEDCLAKTMNAIFEPFPTRSKEDISVKDEPAGNEANETSQGLRPLKED